MSDIKKDAFMLENLQIELENRQSVISRDPAQVRRLRYLASKGRPDENKKVLGKPVSAFFFFFVLLV